MEKGTVRCGSASPGEFVLSMLGLGCVSGKLPNQPSDHYAQRCGPRTAPCTCAVAALECSAERAPGVGRWRAGKRPSATWPRYWLPTTAPRSECWRPVGPVAAFLPFFVSRSYEILSVLAPSGPKAVNSCKICASEKFPPGSSPRACSAPSSGALWPRSHVLARTRNIDQRWHKHLHWHPSCFATNAFSSGRSQDERISPTGTLAGRSVPHLGSLW